MIMKTNFKTVSLLVLELLIQPACATTTASPTTRSTSTAVSARIPLITPQLLNRYVAPEIPVVIAAPHSPQLQGGEGFIAPRGQRIELPYDVLCIDAAAQAAVEASVEYRDNMAQNNCAAAIRSLGAQAARDLSLTDSAAATRENVLTVQARTAMDALTSSNRTIANLREQNTNSSRLGILINLLVGAGGFVVGAGLAALILSFAN